MRVRKMDKFAKTRFYIKEIFKEKRDTMENILRPCTPIESLQQSLKEMQLIRKGQAPRHSLDDLLKELKLEIQKEEK